ncbi:MAG: cysteine desulfurase family protein [Planctomycetota bacterium]
MIFLDHHATTPCDPRVVEAMLPFWTETFGNPHSSSHPMGRAAADAIQHAMALMEQQLGCPAGKLVATSGATESINLAVRGVMLHPRNRRRRLVTCTTEHPAMLETAEDLEKRHGVDVVRVPVHPNRTGQPGQVDLDALRDAVDEQTALVSVMWANNESGVVQPVCEIARIAHEAGALMHSDATQAVGTLAVSVQETDVDLLSASAHKFYGPKGVGLLVAGNGNRRVRLLPQTIGGGQQGGLRGGTMNPAGIVGMAHALAIAAAEPETRESANLAAAALRQQLFDALNAHVDGLTLNGPSLQASAGDSGDWQRLPGNLNLRLQQVEGETWMAAATEVAFSSGSACSSTDGLPSHVLLAMGLTESEARRSVRFGIGRGNTSDEIQKAAEALIAAYARVRG